MKMSEKESPQMNFFVRLILNDPLRKLIAVVSTIFIMVAVILNSRNTQKFSVSGVEVQLEPPKDYVFKTREMPTVTLEVEVTGVDQSDKSDRFKADRFTITKTLTETDVNKGFVILQEKDVEDREKKGRFFELKYKIKDIKPSKIVLDLDKIITRKVPVIASMDTRKLKPGYTLGKSLIPDEFKEVRLTGPRSIISNIQEVRTEEISLDDATGSFVATVPLKKLNQPGVTYSFDQITMPVNIYGRRDRELASIPVKAVISLPNPSGTVYSIEPETVRVQFEEPKTETRTEPGELHPTIEVSGQQGRMQCKVSCTADRPDVTIKGIEPEFVTLTVTGPAAPAQEKKK